MKKVGAIVIVLLGLMLSASAQTSNTFNAKEFSGSTVGEKVTKAQAQCNASATIPCVIILDPILAAFATGTLPTRCAQCAWIDYRTPGSVSISSVAGFPFSVKSFGATGDGVADDTSAVQAAVTAALAVKGQVIFPCGTYLLTAAVTLGSNIDLIGQGGQGCALIKSNTAINLFQVTAFAEFGKVIGLSLQSAGGKAFASTDLTTYVANWSFRDNHFYANNAEGIYANLILCHVVNNTFGYYGTPGVASRHVYSKGVFSGLSSNINFFERNRFYNAVGSESVYLEAGYQVYFDGNNFEHNTSTNTLTIKGLYSVHMTKNWFEGNAGVYQITFANDTSATIGDYVIDVEKNWFDLGGSGNTTIMQLGGATSKVKFDENAGVNMVGKNISDNDNLILEKVRNRFIGVTTTENLTVDSFTANQSMFAANYLNTSNPSVGLLFSSGQAIIRTATGTSTLIQTQAGAVTQATFSNTSALFPGSVGIGGANVTWGTGAGVPSAGTCTTSKGGSLFSRTDGTTTTSLYVCDGTTGVWTAK
jgi:hypothetical protein